MAEWSKASDSSSDPHCGHGFESHWCHFYFFRNIVFILLRRFELSNFDIKNTAILNLLFYKTVLIIIYFIFINYCKKDEISHQ